MPLNRHKYIKRWIIKQMGVIIIQMHIKRVTTWKSRYKGMWEFFVSCCIFYVSLNLFQSINYPKSDTEEVMRKCAMIAVQWLLPFAFEGWAWRQKPLTEVPSNLVQFPRPWLLSKASQRISLFDAWNFVDNHFLLKEKIHLLIQCIPMKCPLCALF